MENAVAGVTSPTARPLRSRSFWFLSASYLLQGYLGYIFIFWFYLYLVQVRHFEVLKAASFTALPWIATMFAIPLGGLFSDLAVERWGATWGRRSVPLVALSAAAIFLVVGARTPNPMLAVAALTVCTVLVLCTEGPFWATMTQLSGEHSGIAGGTMNFGSNLGGMVSPALTPWLAERIGWESALTLTAGLAVLAGLLWLGVHVELATE
jgi:ACS family glucarate transporter-like MFS transporter